MTVFFYYILPQLKITSWHPIAANPAELKKNCKTTPIPNNNINPTNIPVPFFRKSSISTPLPSLIYPQAQPAIINAAPTKANVRRILNTPYIWAIKPHNPALLTPPAAGAANAAAPPATTTKPANPIFFNKFFI